MRSQKIRKQRNRYKSKMSKYNLLMENPEGNKQRVNYNKKITPAVSMSNLTASIS